MDTSLNKTTTKVESTVFTPKYRTHNKFSIIDWCEIALTIDSKDDNVPDPLRPSLPHEFNDVKSSLPLIGLGPTQC